MCSARGRVANADNESWSLYGAQRSQLVATGRKWEGAENGSDKRKPLPWVDGKEGVDGSSPSEGLAFFPAQPRFSLSVLTS